MTSLEVSLWKPLWDIENISLRAIAAKSIVYVWCIGQCKTYQHSFGEFITNMLVQHFHGGILQKNSRHRTVLLVTWVSPKVLYLNFHVVAIFYSYFIHILFAAFASPRRRDVGSVFIRTLVTVFYRLAHLHHLEKMAAIVRFLLHLISGIIISVFFDRFSIRFSISFCHR